MMHLKFEPNRIFISLKKASMSDFFKKVTYKARTKRICTIYIISKQFLDLISYHISSTKKGSDIISYILKKDIYPGYYILGYISFTSLIRTNYQGQTWLIFMTIQMQFEFPATQCTPKKYKQRPSRSQRIFFELAPFCQQ